MKFLISAMAIFASTALAAKYAAGTICHSNIECEKNCLDEQYTIVNDDGGYVFVCDSSVADPVQWYILRCASYGTRIVDPDVTKAACKKVDGESCATTCILSGKRSIDEENRKKWIGDCGEDAEGAPTLPELEVFYSEKDARTYCK
jgi:hypothetical protein